MKTVRKKSQNQESRTAKKFSGKTVIASGALWTMKADVRSDKYLIECKTTDKDFYSITTKVWEKIEKEATNDGLRTPVLVVTLNGKEDYAVFNPSDMEFEVNIYEVIPHVHGGCNSYRFRGCEDLPKLFSINSVDSHKEHHLLMVMPIDDFLAL